MCIWSSKKVVLLSTHCTLIIIVRNKALNIVIWSLQLCIASFAPLPPRSNNFSILLTLFFKQSRKQKSCRASSSNPDKTTCFVWFVFFANLLWSATCDIPPLRRKTPCTGVSSMVCQQGHFSCPRGQRANYSCFFHSLQSVDLSVHSSLHLPLRHLCAVEVGPKTSSKCLMSLNQFYKPTVSSDW